MSYFMQPNLDRLRASVPAQLRELPVWLLWRELPKGKGEKPSKIPYYTNGSCRQGTLDGTEDRKKLATFDAALSSYDERRDAGLGVALGPVPDTALTLSGIDLDESVTHRDGKLDLSGEAVQIIKADGGAYSELSPGRRGIKIFGQADIGEVTPIQTNGLLEIYSRRRFFTVTGEKLEGDEIADLTEAAALARSLFMTSGDGDRRKVEKDRSFAARGRNCALTSLAGQLRARDVPEADALVELRARNAKFPKPLSDKDVLRILHSVWRYPPGYALTDLGNARRLVDRFGEDLRYLPESGKLLIWQGTHWAFDRDGEAERRTKTTVKAIFDEARDCADDERRKKLTAWALTSQGVGRIAAALQLARTEEGIPVAPEQLDADPLLLGVGNGVVDLRTGRLRAARREDYIVMRTTIAFDASAQAPRWRQFLKEIAPDAGLCTYLQQAAGYTLTGLTVEQCLFLLFGSGANGKSTFINTLRRVFGDYATVVDTSTWMIKGKHHDRPPNDLAALRGKRLVVSPESEAGQRFAEVLVKQVTGGDKIRARFLYAEFFEYEPQLKLWISANHKPVIHGDDHAIWRRIRLLPFMTTIAEDKKDKHLEAKLLKELPGILAWAVEGCLMWQREGLVTPECVRKATEDYRSEMDHFGAFLKECCQITSKPAHRVKASMLYEVYRRFAKDEGIEYPWSMQLFGRRLTEQPGVTRAKDRTGWWYQGVQVLVDKQFAAAYQGDADRQNKGGSQQEIKA